MKKSSESPQLILKQFFDKVTKTEKGQELIKKHTFSFQFHVTDGEDFYLEIKNGNFRIEKGGPPEKNVENRTLIEGSSDTFSQVFKGETILWDAGWDRKLKAELYGPSQGYVSWLSQFFKIGRRTRYSSEFFTD